MICQDNHAYNVALGSGDNPLPIQGQDGGKPGKTLPFRAHIMFNGSVPKPKCIPSTVEASEVVGCYNDTGHQCGYEMLQSLPKTNSHRNAATECAGAGYSYGGAEDGLGAEVWCGHGPPNCPKIADSNCGSGCPGNSSEKCGGSWALTALGIRCTHLPPPTTTTVAVRWQPWQGNPHDHRCHLGCILPERASNDRADRQQRARRRAGQHHPEGVLHLGAAASGAAARVAATRRLGRVGPGELARPLTSEAISLGCALTAIVAR